MIRLFVRKLALLVRRRRAMDDLAEEMRLHVELRAESLRRQGVDDAAALRMARRQFGNELALREESGDMWGFSAVENLGKDAHYAYRQLVRRPAWTLMVLLTLALGIGANTSIFAVANAMLFRSAPGQRPEQLVWVAALEGHSGRFRNMSYPAYADLRDRATTMSGLMAYSGNEFSLGGQHAQRVFGGIVSGNYFDVLGIPAAIGRTFAADEDTAPGAHPVVILSDRLWRDRFGGDPDVIGTVAAINGHRFTVIGVAPPDFVGVELGEDALLWVPLAMQRQAMPSNPDLLTDARAGWLRIVGRLRAGRSIAEADAEIHTLSKQTEAPGTRTEDERIAHVTPIVGGLDPANRQELMPIIALISVVPALVLLVACFNVANVLMARNVARRKELAMRRAIGASRARLVTQLLVEALLLALLAAGCGFCVSFGLTAVIARLGSVPAEVTAVLRPDSRALAATTALAALTTLIFGLAPALSATRFELSASLKSEGLSSTAGKGSHRLRNAFVVAQVSVSLALLVAAGLFVQSLSKALSVDPGFDSHGAASVSFDPALQGYTPERGDAFVAQLIEAAAALPGASAASATTVLPLSGRMSAADAVAEDSPARATAMYASIAPRYFDAMRIGVVAGRDFTSADAAGSTPVVIVNQTLARRLWPEGNAIGRRIRVEVRGEPVREVVGIARDGKYARLTEQPRAALYLPLAQRAQPPLPLTVVVRSFADPNEMLRGLVAAAQRIDPDMPLYRVQTLTATVGAIVDRQRATASLLGVFGVIALLLAATGIYGVAAHSVSMRTREIGIRMSLGARVADVSRMFVTEMLALVAVGVALGIAISAAASQLLTAFLFGLGATDAVTFGGAAALIGSVAILASYLPARSAARIDPLLALRQD